jgi:uncharacterized metal-binding protein
MDNSLLWRNKVSDTNCCVGGNLAADGSKYETVRIQKPAGSCGLCESFSEKQKDKPVAVMCCEGSCLRGEIARQASNIICHTLAPEKTVRICLGGAFTKDTGQRSLVRNASRLIAMEGCFLDCATRMMKGVIEGLNPEIIVVDKLYDFDSNLFSANEMSPEEILMHAKTVAQKIAETL